jgi:hypothetical protein
MYNLHSVAYVACLMIQLHTGNVLVPLVAASVGFVASVVMGALLAVSFIQ